MSAGGMKLSALEFMRLLPSFMQDDAAVRGLAEGIDIIVPQLSGSIGRLSTWDKIDELSEADLDALAWELDILWYDKTAAIETKRELVKNSDKVHKHLGTKWAVENVIQTYFGNGYIKEWFEYEGEPGHFRVYSTNATLNNERLNEFLNILEKVKRHSSKLDEIYITLTGELRLFSGVGVREVSRETYAIGARLNKN